MQSAAAGYREQGLGTPADPPSSSQRYKSTSVVLTQRDQVLEQEVEPDCNYEWANHEGVKRNGETVVVPPEFVKLPTLLMPSTLAKSMATNVAFS